MKASLYPGNKFSDQPRSAEAVLRYSGCQFCQGEGRCFLAPRLGRAQSPYGSSGNRLFGGRQKWPDLARDRPVFLLATLECFEKESEADAACQPQYIAEKSLPFLFCIPLLEPEHRRPKENPRLRTALHKHATLNSCLNAA